MTDSKNSKLISDIEDSSKYTIQWKMTANAIVVGLRLPLSGKTLE
jgi:hypothetical protein